MRHISRLRRASHPKYRSHNPLGALMVYALWGTLVVVSLTGIALQNAPIPENEDRYSAEFNHESETFIEELHKATASFLLLLAAVEALPKDVSEAAQIDGATKWQEFRRVSLSAMASDFHNICLSCDHRLHGF